MKFSHQRPDDVLQLHNNIATQNEAMNQTLLDGATEAFVIGITVGALAAGVAGCSSGEDASDVIPRQLPTVECSNASQVTGEIDNWQNGGVVKAWDGRSMTMSYDLQSGENLSQVAACYSTNPVKGVEAIAYENRIKDPNVAPEGELKITISNPVKVRLGEDFSSIEELAATTGFGVNQIFAANGKHFRKDKWNPGSEDVILLPIQDIEDQSTTSTSTTTTTEQPSGPGEKPNRSDEIDEFRQRWDEYATAVEEEFGIDKNAVLAQAILESKFGSSELAIDGSNLFGIKAHRGAKATPYWNGQTISHKTPESLTDEELKDPYWVDRLVKVIGKNNSGENDVIVNADFRQYGSFKDSFMDYGYKIIHEDTYADAAKNKKDPLTYIKEVAKAGYASDPLYIQKVTDIYSILESLSNTGEPTPPTPEPPKSGPGEIINPDELDFSNFPTQERDDKLKNTIKNATSNLNLEEFRDFRKSGVLDKFSFTQGIMNGEGEYHQLLGRRIGSDFKYVVWHAWADGITEEELDVNGGTETRSSHGNTHDVTLTGQVTSWHNRYLDNIPTGAQYLLGDNGEVWRLTETATANKALHAGHGIMDEGKASFPDLNNENSVGIEVQANTIYDATSIEFTKLIYQTANLLIQGKLVAKDMNPDEIRAAVNAAVVGHGKNDSRFNNSGVEFGWKYRQPLLQGVQELLVAYLK